MKILAVIVGAAAVAFALVLANNATSDDTTDGIAALLTAGSSYSPIVQQFAQAISVAEGFGVAGAIPTLANNPGDITDVGQNLPGDTGQRMGANIIVFATATDGWNALYAQVQRMLSGSDSLYPSSATLQAVGGTYASDPTNWPANVVIGFVNQGIDVGINTTLGQIAQLG